MSEETKQPVTGLAKIRQEFQSPQAINMFMDAMPKAAGKQAAEAAKRFAKMTYAAISQSPDLQKCTIRSLIRAASISASLDLDIDARGLAYLVSYKGEANFQIGYLGLIELAYRSGKVKAISAHCIYESEKDSVKIVRKDGQYTVEHPFSYEKPKGKMVAIYATAIVEGINPVTAVLRADEVEELRKKSKAPNSPAWRDFYEAMAKKTAIRQLAKFLPKSIVDEFSRVAAEEEREDFVSAQNAAQTTINKQAGSEIVDVKFEDEAKSETPNEQVDPPSEEPDPATKAKAEKQKAKLKAASKKPAKEESVSEPTNVPEWNENDEPEQAKEKSLYTCNDCGARFDEPKTAGKGATQVAICAKCFSKNIKANE